MFQSLLQMPKFCRNQRNWVISFELHGFSWCPHLGDTAVHNLATCQNFCQAQKPPDLRAMRFGSLQFRSQTPKIDWFEPQKQQTFNMMASKVV